VSDGDAKLTASRGRSAAETMTLVDYAVERLREDILAGDLLPGARLRLDAVAEELGMSPIPLREALRTLSTQGLVTPLPRRGFSVAPLTVKDLDDAYRLRIVLEPMAVQLAVPRLRNDDLAEQRVRLQLLEDAFREGNWPNHRLHHRGFHFGFYERCNSDWLLRFIESLWVNTERYQRITTNLGGELKERMKEHRRILSAARKGDGAGAAELMRDHLSRAAASIRTLLLAQEHVLDSRVQ
jgi:DNA-binding GntR family transcriptional regulator